MNFFTKFSIKNPAVIFILVLLVTLGGVYSASGLKQETMPDISIPIIAVVTPYPGSGPSDVLDDVTKPLEKSLSSISGIKTVNSTSSENVSAVIAEFSYSADMDKAKQEVEEAVKKVKLPEGVMEPQITRISFGSFPILKLSVTNEKLSTAELEKEIRDTLMPKLAGIEGVGQVQIASEKQKNVFVKLLPEKLKKYNLTTQTVTQLLQANNISFPTGSVKMGERAKPVRVTGEIKTLAELKNLKLPLFPNAQDGMKDAFGQIGQGMGALGEAVGQMGQGMMGLGQGLGGQIQLLSAIQDTQANIFAGKLALNDAKATLNNPNATEQEKQMATMTIQQLTPQLQIGEMALKQMQDQLKKIQAMMQQGAGSSQKPTSSSKKTTSSTSNNSMAIKQIKLSQIAEITVGEKEAEVYSRTDGKDSIVIDLIKAQDANTVDVVDNAQAAMVEMKDKLPKGTNFTVIMDQGKMVKQSVNGMVREGLLGAAFAALVIMLFLRNLRSTIIALVSIPLSILITLLLIKQAGITLNIMTLGGLTVAVGRVVDDSIVVIENIFRKLQTETYRTLDIVIMGTKEVASAITSSTLTTVAVFIPLGLVEGMIGKIFMPFALTVALALLSSLIVAITIVPLLAKLLLLKAKVPQHEENYEGPIMSVYRKALVWSLNHKAIVIILSIVMLIGSFSLVPLIGTSFIPESKEKFVSIDVEYPAGTNINTVNKKSISIEKYLAGDKSVSTFQTTVGSVTGSMNNYGKVEGSNVSHIFIALAPEANVDDLIKKYRQEFPGDDKVKITVNQASTGGSGNTNKLEVIVRGSKLPEIREGAKILTKELAKVDSLDNVANNLGESKPEIAINVDQAKASKVGLSAAQIMGTIRELLNYKEIGTINVNNEELKMNLGLKMKAVNKLKDMQNLELTTPLGKVIKLSSVAQVKEIPGPTSLYTRNGEEYANVSASILGNDTGKVTSDVQARIETLKLPDGVTTQIGGTVEQMNESFKQLGIAMIVAVLSVYLVMVIAFSEALAPFAILFSLPLAIIGGLVGLFIAGIPLNMPAMIGALMLIGIVVTNAIVLLDRVKQQEKQGVSVRESLIDAGTVRMRPILMTAIATITALLPLALGHSEGALISQALAVVVIGGLTSSTLLTLIIVPVAYELLSKFKRAEAVMDEPPVEPVTLN